MVNEDFTVRSLIPRPLLERGYTHKIYAHGKGQQVYYALCAYTNIVQLGNKGYSCREQKRFSSA